jgi:hypothetical protein
VLAVVGIERRLCCKRKEADGIFQSGVVVSAGHLEPVQLTRRGILMILIMDVTVNNPSLEAGVGVTKGYRGCHRIRVVLR